MKKLLSLEMPDVDKAFVVISRDRIVRKVIVDIYTALVIVILKSDEDRKTLLVIDKLVDGTIYKRFNKLTYTIGKAVRFSEILNDDLRKCLKKYATIVSHEELFNRNNKCRKLAKYDLTKPLTFMQMKQVLSCIVKTESRLHQIESLDTSEKRKQFTLLLNDYIIDRDWLVHGTLHFLYPEFMPVLKIIDNTIQSYVKIEENILPERITAFQSLQGTIGEITWMLQELNQ